MKKRIVSGLGGIGLLVACTPTVGPEEEQQPQELIQPAIDSSAEKEEQDSLSLLEQLDSSGLRISPKASAEERAKIMEIISKEYLMGQFNPATDQRFERIERQYLVYPERKIFIRKEAMAKFKEMQARAKEDGIALKIMSATRPFNVQKAIWERKWRGEQRVNGKFVPQDAPQKAKAEQILEWNSMPSTSRHHWGTDIDINNINPAYWLKGQGAKEYAWLVAHAAEFGFCQVYSAGRPYGYQEEKWHWSYIPLAKEFTNQYKKYIKDQDIHGFLGAEAAAEIEVVKKYVLGINPDCL